MQSSLLPAADAQAPTRQSPQAIEAALATIASQAATCQQCALCQGRTHSVFSRGNPHAPLMLIGEGPGQHEDETGLPFVGKAGQLLDRILASMAIDRDRDIYICNIVKCRPPQNRAPLPEEMAACRPYLQAQIDLIQPRLILLAGATALKGALNLSGITRLRGRWLPTPFHGAVAMPVFHPSYLLRYASKEKGSPKWLTWQDIQEVRRALDALPQMPTAQ
ncbi:MAG: uracil-DNA glycosylase [Vampirovibrionales bacterium]|nr:uracil-DNA glycosylase [Vampirovibrionales bacterium]